jgi:hypothetical protein
MLPANSRFRRLCGDPHNRRYAGLSVMVTSRWCHPRGTALKRAGFCPSCGTRRMVDTAVWLVDRVLPEVPVRQWVLALPPASASSAPTTPPPAPASAASSSAPSRPSTSDALATRASPTPASSRGSSPTSHCLPTLPPSPSCDHRRSRLCPSHRTSSSTVDKAPRRRLFALIDDSTEERLDSARVNHSPPPSFDPPTTPQAPHRNPDTQLESPNRQTRIVTAVCSRDRGHGRGSGPRRPGCHKIFPVRDLRPTGPAG